ncbi:galactoside 2-alpha-L-fucosyltransferase 2 isoform X2 [Eurytemora carolleeae]|uniref:galactoside 2-alpha-L-fucosyltransferase 2 isoform X1 n=1 Tax=Eurytemora carolleeae TaxID=1294199 RepID=UPI000C7894A6|nr:galactoside 2-alpha-L-fucosyltransferase 2 isoform X1 [Eurytemora carolleeae]XP_023331316.1 galactoside 2-alpha-L-fucosyltransferase 2 isoform X2 [Eurytemora carolleeae]|eukprot:XP_023331315.1 galactoside 2-alpha-L-fucosyltransferase 2-like isoform X1 [Eurytemora affinis]
MAKLRKSGGFIIILMFLGMIYVEIYTRQVTFNLAIPAEQKIKNSDCLIETPTSCLLALKKNKDPSLNQTYCHGSLDKELICDNMARSVVKSSCETRLGNQIVVFATFLYMRKKGFVPYLSSFQYNLLSETFNSSYFTVEKGVEHFETYKPPRIPIYESEWDTWHYHFHQFEKDVHKYRYNQYLDIGEEVPWMGPNCVWIQLEVWKELSLELVYRDDIVAAAKIVRQDLLKKIRKEYSLEEIIFVGIHVRRTDFTEKGIGLIPESMYWFQGVDKMFLLHSMNIFRERFDDSQHKSVFLMLSDDADWVKNNFLHLHDVFLPVHNHNLPENQLPGLDMYLLKSCDHTIRTFGTFGSTGGLQAGGITVYPIHKDISYKFYFPEEVYWRNFETLSDTSRVSRSIPVEISGFVEQILNQTQQSN